MKKLRLIKDFFCAKFLKKNKPLLIGWDLTYRCNFNCKYCDASKLDGGYELSTDKIILIIEQLNGLGTRRIHFTGGEVLLRDDLGVILTRCRELNIFSAILTNGLLFRQKLDDLKKTDLVMISFDGPKKVQDNLRAPGSFDKIMDAVELSKKEKIKIFFNVTLSKDNIDEINYILDCSEKLNVPAKFQFVNNYLAGGKDIIAIKISIAQRKAVLEKLIAAKIKNRPIVNSLAGLRYLYNYPQTLPIACSSGAIFARISADGYLYPCAMFRDDAHKVLCVGVNFKDAFAKLTRINCKHCLCSSTLELNYIYSLRLEAVLNGLREF